MNEIVQQEIVNLIGRYYLSAMLKYQSSEKIVTYDVWFSQYTNI